MVRLARAACIVGAVASALALCGFHKAAAQEGSHPRAGYDPRRRAESETRRRDSEELRLEDQGISRAAELGRRQDLNARPHDQFRSSADLNARIKADKTIARVERGQADTHSNDGATFENREQKLPPKEAGYYKEYVYREPGAKNPGPERVVIGKEKEVYYTPDHYESFQKVR